MANCWAMDHLPISIVVPSGKDWEVNWHIEGEERIVLGHGWVDFLSFYDATIDHFTVWKHVGRCSFEVQIVDNRTKLSIDYEEIESLREGESDWDNSDDE